MRHSATNYTTQEMVNPCVGSIQWGINNNRCYDVNGVYMHGSMMANADSHFHAAQQVLYKGPNHSVWVPNGTIMEVWRVGPHYSYMRHDKQVFQVFDGEPFPMGSVRS